MTTININSIKMNYKITGKGFPIVLIHGLSDDLNYWKYLSKYLEKYYKVISMDLRGHGKTDEGKEKYSMDLIKDDVIKLLKKLDINKCHLIGFSLGGQISLKIAVENPEIVSKLILISTLSRADNYTNKNFKIMLDSIDESFECFYDTMINYVLPEDITKENKNKLDEIKLIQSRNKNRSAIIKTLETCRNFNIYNKISEIKNKTLITYGEDEEIISYNNIKELEKIPDSKIVSFPNTKHNTLIKRNFNEAKNIIIDFLKN
ncbi:MAG: alpha/beta fold hydrolase [Methanobrevibacter sp.]